MSLDGFVQSSARDDEPGPALPKPSIGKLPGGARPASLPREPTLASVWARARGAAPLPPATTLGGGGGGGSGAACAGKGQPPLGTVVLVFRRLESVMKPFSSSSLLATCARSRSSLGEGVKQGQGQHRAR